MSAGAVDTRQLATDLAAAMPELDREAQRVAIALYRLLAEGAPVAPEHLARRTGLSADAVHGLLESWPGVHLGGDGVVGFWGLALEQMPHRLHVDGRELRAWCAWDTLFLPELIGRPATVESTCPTTGETVTMSVHPHDGPGEVSPAGAVLSFLRPDAPFDANMVQTFCHFVHFFRDQHAADAWTGEHANTFTLSIDEGFELGHLTNQAKFGLALGPGRTTS